MGGHYPAYVQEFPPGRLLGAKAAQHYLSIRLSQPTQETVFMDAASSGSPFWRIIQRVCGVSTAFRQDLNFREGVHGDTIGSNAAEIPLPNGCLSLVTSHCSWEHFEGNTDVAFLEECARLLRPGGTMVIVPLYFADRYAIQTSPHVWSSKYSKNSDCPEFDETSSIYLREEIRQRQSKYYTAPVLIERVLEPLSDRFDFQVHHFENYREIDGCPAFALKAIKT